MAERIILSQEQLDVLQQRLKESDKKVISVENTNMNHCIACHLNGGKFLLDDNGRTFELSW